MVSIPQVSVQCSILFTVDNSSTVAGNSATGSILGVHIQGVVLSRVGKHLNFLGIFNRSSDRLVASGLANTLAVDSDALDHVALRVVIASVNVNLHLVGIGDIHDLGLAVIVVHHDTVLTGGQLSGSGSLVVHLGVLHVDNQGLVGIGSFAPYGYRKDPEDKNSLVIDEEAAQVVLDIFKWFVTEGMSKNGIAKRLNELGIPNPTAYKRSQGYRYQNPHATANDGLWNPTTVGRMLQDQLYIGVMRQGRQKVISYKVHKRAAVPESEWFIVENAVPAIVSREMFDMAQEVHKRDTRTAPGKREVYPFAGLVRCADCKKGMARHSSKGKVYYACRTYREKSKERCTKHSIRLDILENAVLVAIQKQIDMVASLKDMIAEINAAPVVRTQSVRLEALLTQRTKELDKVTGLLDGLYMDWKSGDITRDQYRRMKVKFEEQAAQLQEAVDHIKAECDTLAQGITAEDPYLTTFLKYGNIQSLSRGILVELVKTIYVHEGGELEIEFNFADQFRRIVEFIENNKNDLYVIGGKAV